MDLCPIESADTLVSVAEMKLVIKGIDQLKERADIDDVQKRSMQWDQQLRQLLKSLITSSGDFMKQSKKAENAARKEEKEARAKATKEEEGKHVAEEEMARNIIGKMKASNNFTADWASNGHHAITVVSSSGAWDVQQMSDADYNCPAILKDIDVLTKIFEGDNDFVKASRRFSNDASKRFQPTKTKLKEVPNSTDTTCAPMLDVLGTSLLQPLVHMIIPNNHKLPDTLPSLRQVLAKPWWVAISKTAIIYGHETDYIGSIRLICDGSLRYLMAPAKDLFSALPEEAKKPSFNQKSKFDAMKNMFKLTSEVEIKKLADSGVKIYHGIVGPKQALVAPPGFIIAYTPVDDIVVGVKQAFLPNSQIAFANLTVLNQVLSSQTLSGYVDLLSVNKNRAKK